MGLNRSDVDGAVESSRLAALVGGDAAGNERRVTRGDSGTARQWRHGLRQSAIVAKRGEERVERAGVGSGHVGADPSGAVVGPSDQVVTQRRERPEGVGSSRGGAVRGNDRVGQIDGAVDIVHAPRRRSAVAADGAVVERGRAGNAIKTVDQAAALDGGIVATDRAVGESHEAWEARL